MRGAVAPFALLTVHPDLKSHPLIHIGRPLRMETRRERFGPAPWS